MADSLYLSIAKRNSTIQQGAYWWPLIFEAMRRTSFQFYPAESIEKQGSYFVENKIECTFQELWDVLYVGHDMILVFFWPSDAHVDPFRLDVSVKAAKNGEWQLDVTLEDGYLDGRKIEQDKYRLNALLQAGLALYELCFPCTIRMYWDELYWGNTYTDLLQVRTSPEEKPLEPLRLGNHLLQWKEKACIANQHIYIVDPLPVHVWANRSRFVSLFPDTMMTTGIEEGSEEH